jgi:hypothetical protein
MSQGLITLLIGVCVYLWYSRFRHVAMWRKDTTLRDCAFDLAELKLPPGWRAGRDLNESAGIEAVDLRHSRYGMVISESRDDYEGSLDLETYAVGVRESLTSDLRHLTMSGPERLKVDGCDAVQFEFEGVDVVWVRFLFTVVIGRRALHQIVGWSPRSAYSRKAFEELLRGFRERPGPAAWPESKPTVANRPGAIGFLRASAKTNSSREVGD